jgi:hypothetical protein
MRDYEYMYEDGRCVKVADLPTQEILDVLAVGVNPLHGESPEAIMERLRLELFIRERGLRTEH